MNVQVSTLIFLSILGLLAVLSCIDVFKRIIPNALSVLILMMTLTAAAFAEDTIWSEILVRFVVLFIPLIALYIGGALGAGDVKLISALAPIIPLNTLIDFAVYTFFGRSIGYFRFNLFDKNPCSTASKRAVWCRYFWSDFYISFSRKVVDLTKIRLTA